jgi:hypothetical protein
MLAAIEHSDDSGTHSAIEFDPYVLTSDNDHLSDAQLAARQGCRDEAEPPVCHKCESTRYHIREHGNSFA